MTEVKVMHTVMSNQKLSEKIEIRQFEKTNHIFGGTKCL